MADNTDKPIDSRFSLVPRARENTYAPVEYVDIPSAEVDEAEGASFSEYLEMIKRHKLAIAACALFFAVSGGLIAKRPQIPTYSALATIQFQQPDIPTISIRSGYQQPQQGVGLYTQIAILQSPSMLDRVRADLKTRHNHDFHITYNRLWEWLMAKGIPIATRTLTDDRAIAMTERTLVVNMGVAGSNMLLISCEGPDSELAADYVNTLVKVYMDWMLETKVAQSKRAVDYLDNQTNDLYAKLQRSQTRLQEYAQEHGILGKSATGSATVAAQKLSEIQRDLSTATTTRMNAQFRWEKVKDVPLESLSDIEDNGIIVRMQEQLESFRQELALQKTIYTPEYPKVQETQTKIDNTIKGIRAEQTRLVNRIKSEFETAQVRERQLAESYAQQNEIVSQQGGASIQYDILSSQVDTDRQLYQQVLQQQKETNLNSAIQQSPTVNLIDPARASSIPNTTSTVRMIFLGFVGGLVIGVGYSVIREKLDNRLKSPGSVATQVRLTELGVIPAAHLEEQSNRALPLRLTSIGLKNGSSVELLTWNKKTSLVAESFRATVASILFSQNGHHASRVLIVSSPQMSEGKTTTVTNLGIALAEIGRKVVLIDGDIRHPRLHRIFSTSNEIGLTDILDGKMPINVKDRYVLETQVPGLHLIPSGQPNGSISRLLYSPRMQELIAELRANYDIVLIDSPPILQVPDARVLGRAADAAILVFKAGSTSMETASASRARFSEDGIHIMGCILNNWNPKVGGYGQGYYGAYYGSYYQNYSQRADD